MEYDVALIVGPESSGTRAYTYGLSQHPDVSGSMRAFDHTDILDEVWCQIHSGNIERAKKEFPNCNKSLLITRRSMPHARKDAQSANFMDFPHLKRFVRLCKSMDKKVILLITVRNFTANIQSWTEERSSAEGSTWKAITQYNQSYREIFEIICTENVDFQFLSLESLAMEGSMCLRSVYNGIGLDDFVPSTDRKPYVNIKRYHERGVESESLATRNRINIGRFINNLFDRMKSIFASGDS
jgi:hypothetical protein